MVGSQGSAKYAQVTYAAHARLRMRERFISERQIVNTLEQPDRSFPSKGKLVAERATARGNTLRVVYVEQVGPLGLTAHVISVVRRRGTRP